MKLSAYLLLALCLFAFLIDLSMEARKKRSNNSSDDDDDEPVKITKLNGYDSKYAKYIREKEAKWKAATVSVYNLTIWPYNDYYIQKFFATKGTNNLSWLPNTVNTSASVRVHAFGDHFGVLDIAEYYYGLTPNTILFDPKPSYFILGFDLTAFFVNVAAKTAFSTIQYRIGQPGTAPATWRNSTQVGTWRYDNSDKIVEAILWNPLYSLGQRESGAFKAPGYQFFISNYTCHRHQKFCANTPYSQYANWDACMSFLNTIPLGEPDVFTANNTMCRHQHSTLVQLRPEIHCAHIGPSGGAFCVDKKSTTYFTEPFFPDWNRLAAPFTKYN